MNIRTTTSYAAVMGHPIGHSLSPALHNSIYEKLKMDMAYLAFDVMEEDLEKAINGFKSLGFKGFNVTIPYKEKVIPFLDEIDPMAEAIKAVNTVKIQNGSLYGYNTDGLGFLNSLAMDNIDCRDKNIVILGAGGSARAIGFSLVKKNPKAILILNRSRARGESLARDINNFAEANLALYIENIPEDIDIIINTTPLGMWPNVNADPLEGYEFTPQTVVCDIVYNPYITNLLKRAEASNCKTVEGIGMLVGQGIKAIEIWTGQSIDSSIAQSLCQDLKKVLAR